MPIQLVLRVTRAAFLDAHPFFVAFQIAGRPTKKRTEVAEPASATPVYKRNTLAFDLADADVELDPAAAAAPPALRLQIGVFIAQAAGAPGTPGSPPSSLTATASFSQLPGLASPGGETPRTAAGATTSGLLYGAALVDLRDLLRALVDGAVQLFTVQLKRPPSSRAGASRDGTKPPGAGAVNMQVGSIAIEALLRDADVANASVAGLGRSLATFSMRAGGLTRRGLGSSDSASRLAASPSRDASSSGSPSPRDRTSESPGGAGDGAASAGIASPVPRRPAGATLARAPSLAEIDASWDAALAGPRGHHFHPHTASGGGVGDDGGMAVAMGGGVSRPPPLAAVLEEDDKERDDRDRDRDRDREDVAGSTPAMVHQPAATTATSGGSGTTDDEPDVTASSAPPVAVSLQTLSQRETAALLSFLADEALLTAHPPPATPLPQVAPEALGLGAEPSAEATSAATITSVAARHASTQAPPLPPLSDDEAAALPPAVGSALLLPSIWADVHAFAAVAAAHWQPRREARCVAPVTRETLEACGVTDAVWRQLAAAGLGGGISGGDDADDDNDAPVPQPRPIAPARERVDSTISSSSSTGAGGAAIADPAVAAAIASTLATVGISGLPSAAALGGEGTRTSVPRGPGARNAMNGVAGGAPERPPTHPRSHAGTTAAAADGTTLGSRSPISTTGGAPALGDDSDVTGAAHSEVPPPPLHLGPSARAGAPPSPSAGETGPTPSVTVTRGSGAAAGGGALLPVATRAWPWRDKAFLTKDVLALLNSDAAMEASAAGLPLAGGAAAASADGGSPATPLRKIGSFSLASLAQQNAAAASVGAHGGHGGTPKPHAPLMRAPSFSQLSGGDGVALDVSHGPGAGAGGGGLSGSGSSHAMLARAPSFSAHALRGALGASTASLASGGVASAASLQAAGLVPAAAVSTLLTRFAVARLHVHGATVRTRGLPRPQWLHPGQAPDGGLDGGNVRYRVVASLVTLVPPAITAAPGSWSHDATAAEPPLVMPDTAAALGPAADAAATASVSWGDTLMMFAPCSASVTAATPVGGGGTGGGSATQAPATKRVIARICLIEQRRHLMQRGATGGGVPSSSGALTVPGAATAAGRGVSDGSAGPPTSQVHGLHGAAPPGRGRLASITTLDVPTPSRRATGLAAPPLPPSGAGAPDGVGIERYRVTLSRRGIVDIGVGIGPAIAGFAAGAAPPTAGSSGRVVTPHASLAALTSTGTAVPLPTRVLGGPPLMVEPTSARSAPMEARPADFGSGTISEDDGGDEERLELRVLASADVDVTGLPPGTQLPLQLSWASLLHEDDAAASDDVGGDASSAAPSAACTLTATLTLLFAPAYAAFERRQAQARAQAELESSLGMAIPRPRLSQGDLIVGPHSTLMRPLSHRDGLDAASLAVPDVPVGVLQVAIPHVDARVKPLQPGALAGPPRTAEHLVARLLALASESDMWSLTSAAWGHMTQRIRETSGGSGADGDGGSPTPPRPRQGSLCDAQWLTALLGVDPEALDAAATLPAAAAPVPPPVADALALLARVSSHTTVVPAAELAVLHSAHAGAKARASNARRYSDGPTSAAAAAAAAALASGSDDAAVPGGSSDAGQPLWWQLTPQFQVEARIANALPAVRDALATAPSAATTAAGGGGSRFSFGGGDGGGPATSPLLSPTGAGAGGEGTANFASAMTAAAASAWPSLTATAAATTAPRRLSDSAIGYGGGHSDAPAVPAYEVVVVPQPSGSLIDGSAVLTARQRRAQLREADEAAPPVLAGSVVTSQPAIRVQALPRHGNRSAASATGLAGAVGLSAGGITAASHGGDDSDEDAASGRRLAGRDRGGSQASAAASHAASMASIASGVTGVTETTAVTAVPLSVAAPSGASTTYSAGSGASSLQPTASSASLLGGGGSHSGSGSSHSLRYRLHFGGTITLPLSAHTIAQLTDWALLAGTASAAGAAAPPPGHAESAVGVASPTHGGGTVAPASAPKKCTLGVALRLVARVPVPATWMDSSAPLSAVRVHTITLATSLLPLTKLLIDIKGASAGTIPIGPTLATPRVMPAMASPRVGGGVGGGPGHLTMRTTKATIMVPSIALVDHLPDSLAGGRRGSGGSSSPAASQPSPPPVVNVSLPCTMLSLTMPTQAVHLTHHNGHVFPLQSALAAPPLSGAAAAPASDVAITFSFPKETPPPGASAAASSYALLGSPAATPSVTGATAVAATAPTSFAASSRLSVRWWPIRAVTLPWSIAPQDPIAGLTVHRRVYGGASGGGADALPPPRLRVPMPRGAGGGVLGASSSASPAALAASASAASLASMASAASAASAPASPSAGGDVAAAPSVATAALVSLDLRTCIVQSLLDVVLPPSLLMLEGNDYYATIAASATVNGEAFARDMAIAAATRAFATALVALPAIVTRCEREQLRAITAWLAALQQRMQREADEAHRAAEAARQREQQRQRMEEAEARTRQQRERERERQEAEARERQRAAAAAAAAAAEAEAREREAEQRRQRAAADAAIAEERAPAAHSGSAGHRSAGPPPITAVISPPSPANVPPADDGDSGRASATRKPQVDGPTRPPPRQWGSGGPGNSAGELGTAPPLVSPLPFTNMVGAGRGGRGGSGNVSGELIADTRSPIDMTSPSGSGFASPGSSSFRVGRGGGLGTRSTRLLPSSSEDSLEVQRGMGMTLPPAGGLVLRGGGDAMSSFDVLVSPSGMRAAATDPIAAAATESEEVARRNAALAVCGEEIRMLRIALAAAREEARAVAAAHSDAERRRAAEEDALLLVALSQTAAAASASAASGLALSPGASASLVAGPLPPSAAVPAGARTPVLAEAEAAVIRAIRTLADVRRAAAQAAPPSGGSSSARTGGSGSSWGSGGVATSASTEPAHTIAELAHRVTLLAGRYLQQRAANGVLLQQLEATRQDLAVTRAKVLSLPSDDLARLLARRNVAPMVAGLTAGAGAAAPAAGTAMATAPGDGASYGAARAGIVAPGGAPAGAPVATAAATSSPITPTIRRQASASVLSTSGYATLLSPGGSGVPMHRSPSHSAMVGRTDATPHRSTAAIGATSHRLSLSSSVSGLGLPAPASPAPSDAGGAGQVVLDDALTAALVKALGVSSFALVPLTSAVAASPTPSPRATSPAATRAASPAAAVAAAPAPSPPASASSSPVIAGIELATLDALAEGAKALGFRSAAESTPDGKALPVGAGAVAISDDGTILTGFTALGPRTAALVGAGIDARATIPALTHARLLDQHTSLVRVLTTTSAEARAATTKLRDLEAAHLAAAGYIQTLQAGLTKTTLMRSVLESQQQLITKLEALLAEATAGKGRYKRRWTVAQAQLDRERERQKEHERERGGGGSLAASSRRLPAPPGGGSSRRLAVTTSSHRVAASGVGMRGEAGYETDPSAAVASEAEAEAPDRDGVEAGRSGRAAAAAAAAARGRYGRGGGGETLGSPGSARVMRGSDGEWDGDDSDGGDRSSGSDGGDGGGSARRDAPGRAGGGAGAARRGGKRGGGGGGGQRSVTFAAAAEEVDIADSAALQAAMTDPSVGARYTEHVFAAVAAALGEGVAADDALRSGRGRLARFITSALRLSLDKQHLLRSQLEADAARYALAITAAESEIAHLRARLGLSLAPAHGAPGTARDERASAMVAATPAMHSVPSMTIGGVAGRGGGSNGSGTGSIIADVEPVVSATRPPPPLQQQQQSVSEARRGGGSAAAAAPHRSPPPGSSGDGAAAAVAAPSTSTDVLQELQALLAMPAPGGASPAHARGAAQAEAGMALSKAGAGRTATGAVSGGRAGR